MYGNCINISPTQKRGTQKGYIDLTKVKVVEKVLDGAFDKPSFQVLCAKDIVLEESQASFVWK